VNSDAHCQKAAPQAGRWIKTLEGYRAFHPNPLPPRIEWTQPLAVALANASTLVGKLAGEGRRLPNPPIKAICESPNASSIRKRTDSSFKYRKARLQQFRAKVRQ
jgi:hypothetical protein